MNCLASKHVCLIWVGQSYLLSTIRATVGLCMGNSDAAVLLFKTCSKTTIWFPSLDLFL